jgi:hypothetical protein
VKLISKLIVLLFLFLSQSSISQVVINRTDKNEGRTPRVNTPIETNRYRSILPHKPQPSRPVLNEEKLEQEQPKKEKNSLKTSFKPPQNRSVLDGFSSQYWSIQSDIKKKQKQKVI